MAHDELLRHDLAILEAMVGHTGAYLLSDATRWDMGRPDMPPMTLGGCLMRLRRLSVLASRLESADQETLGRARAAFEDGLQDQVIRFERRAHRELHARLREWTVYLRDLAGSASLAARDRHYANQVDTRVVIGELVDRLSGDPYVLEAHVPEDLVALDHRLAAVWEKGPFVWAPVWEPAYPADAFWYLYGHPRSPERADPRVATAAEPTA